jgi:hypothetical protein
VDNSEIGKQAMAEGKPPKCIHVYNKKGVGTIGMYLGRRTLIRRTYLIHITGSFGQNS